MSPHRLLRRVAVPSFAAIAILAVACGGSTEAHEPDDDGAEQLPPAAGACLEGTVDCQDTPLDGAPPLLDDEPVGEPADRDGSTPLLVGGGLTVAELLATDAEGTLAVRGFYYSDGSSSWLCDALAESFPPQCGGERVAFEGVSVIDPDEVEHAQRISWSAQPVSLLGSIVDGVFVATPFAQ